MELILTSPDSGKQNCPCLIKIKDFEAGGNPAASERKGNRDGKETEEAGRGEEAARQRESDIN